MIYEFTRVYKFDDPSRLSIEIESDAPVVAACK